MSYADRRAASLARPPIDIRPYLACSPRHQQHRPLCLPFSIAAAHESTRSMEPQGPSPVLCVEALWAYCVANGTAGPDGALLRDVGHALNNSGHTLEARWPYNPRLGAGTEPAPSAALSDPWVSAQLVNLPLLNDGIEEQLDAALELLMPVVVVLEVTNEFETPSPSGEIDLPPLNAPAGDYHAVLIVGAETNTTGTSRRLLVRNSWGSRWGAGGCGWLPIDYLTAFGAEAAVVDPTSCGERVAGFNP